jgi:hypothetical protein
MLYAMDKKRGDRSLPKESDVSDVALNARICSTQTLGGRSHSRVSHSRAIALAGLGYGDAHSVSRADAVISFSYGNSHFN